MRKCSHAKRACPEKIFLGRAHTFFMEDKASIIFSYASPARAHCSHHGVSYTADVDNR
jgi:hypothetical protein